MQAVHYWTNIYSFKKPIYKHMKNTRTSKFYITKIFFRHIAVLSHQHESYLVIKDRYDNPLAKKSEHFNRNAIRVRVTAQNNPLRLLYLHSSVDCWTQQIVHTFLGLKLMPP